MDIYQKEVIVKIVEQDSVLIYAQYAVLAFLLYDTALLFDNEVKYFWQPHKKFLNYLYFFTRYNGILCTILSLIYITDTAQTALTMLSHKSDTGYYLTILGSSSIVLIDYILLLRARALYSKGRVITIILAIAFAIEIMSGMAIGIQGSIEEKHRPVSLVPGITYCESIAVSSYQIVASWCIPLAYGIFLMSLAVYKSAKILKEGSGLNISTIIKITVRDQMVYFMAMILISASRIVTNFVPSSIPEIIVITSVGSPAILSSVGARLLLNMKEAGSKGLNEGMGSAVTRATISGMDFAEPARISVLCRDENVEGMDEEMDMDNF